MKRWQVVTGVVLVAVVLGLGWYMSGEGVGLQKGLATPWVPLVIVFAAGLFGLPVTLGAWRKLDEAQKEAHKWSWYWGASAGFVLPFPVFLMACFAEPGTFVDPTLSHEQVFVFAYGLVFASVCLCVWIAHLIWWARHR